MEELQSREITPDDYDVLLQLENKNAGAAPLGNYMALAFKEEQMDCHRDLGAEVTCMSCQQNFTEDDEAGPDDRVDLKNCQHVVHFKCLEELFDVEKNQCL